MPKQKIVPIFILLSGFCASTYGQTETRTATLQRAAVEQATKEKAQAITLQRLAKEKNWPLVFNTRNGGLAALTGVDPDGYPIYTTTDNNIVAAATIGTSKLWPGGVSGFNLNGSAAGLKGKIGVWDGGQARSTHVELTGRISNKDNVAISDHTTHVSGTMIASGVNPLAKGMAFGLQELVVYDFDDNISEMMTESGNGMLISNHSYGTIAGWYQNPSENNRWEFRGQAGANEDYKFGFYNSEAWMWDSIAFNAPNHLIVKSSGNNRNQIGPAVGATYWRYNSNNEMINAGARPAGISSNDGYDIIPMSGVAKNILTVGAIDPLLSGYSRPEDVSIADFSSWGPTDDGRIKPDVVADGVELLSSIGTSDNSYGIFSGTSMASPSAAGSLVLLQDEYSKLHAGAFMRSATLKGVVIHTADEAGPTPGPDYKYGWGVINMVKAATQIIRAAAGTEFMIRESTLTSGVPYTVQVVASGKGTLAATLCWTDPKGTVLSAAIDINTPQLVHDLDLRITRGGTTYLPWVLNPASPAAAATTGDNKLDNVEKVEIGDVIPGEVYTITVSNKNTLARGSQAYSLIVSGIGGATYCESAASATQGARIDSVSFGNIQKKNVATCVGYSDFRSTVGSVEPNSTVPLYVKLNACSGGAVDKVAKVFMDFNNDGDFSDAGEFLLGSAAINGDGELTGSVAIPGTVTPGNYSILRVVVMETSNPADVVPCGVYAKGQTQDFRIRFATPSNDVGITDIVSPQGTGCARANQFVTIRFKNLSVGAKSGITLSGTVKDDATALTVATLSGIWAGSVAASGEIEYTFQTPFAPVAGKSYTINVKATVAGDQNAANDEQTMNFVVSSQGTAPTAQAEVCNNSVLLKVTNPGSDVILWYESATATNPIATGATTSTTVVRPDKTYYIGRNDLQGKVGPANKEALGLGGYSTLQNFYIKFSNQVPVTIETAKLYIGAAGQIEFILANLGTVTGTSYTYFPIASKTLDVYATGSGGSDPGAIFALNFTVTDPGDHIIICRPLNGASIYRNNGVQTNPYPVGIPNVFTITGNSNTDPNDANFYQKFYYWFYDMGIKLSGCGSSRGSVVASTLTAPVITLNGNNFSSNAATGNQWYLNSAPIPGATGQTYQATQNGIYKSVITSALGCQLSSNEITYGVTGVPNVDPAAIGLKVMPNPNDGRFTLDFTVNKKADLDIMITNAIGQKVFMSRTPGFIGRFTQSINAGKLPSGVYMLQVQHDNKSYLRKLIVR